MVPIYLLGAAALALFLESCATKKAQKVPAKDEVIGMSEERWLENGYECKNAKDHLLSRISRIFCDDTGAFIDADYSIDKTIGANGTLCVSIFRYMREVRCPDGRIFKTDKETGEIKMVRDKKE